MVVSEFTRTFTHPKNYSQFIKNSEYKQIINITIDICENFIRMQSNLKTEVQNIIDSVNNEIGE